MPTYEYKCAKCGKEFEEFQAISDPPVTICPDCGGKTERVISGGAGLIFKGSGFYITDYKNKSRDARPGAKSSPDVTKPSTSTGNSK